MHVLHRQILLTLAYTDQFEYPLTTRELWLRLINTNHSSHLQTADFIHALSWLQTHQFIKYVDGYWMLSNGTASVAKRNSRKRTSEDKRIALYPLLVVCRWIPWVVGVAVTGSLAMNNADKRDDTDLMIVTENNRLWLVRPLLILFSYISGKRRSWNNEEENSWCFNLWLERRTLAVPSNSRTLYTAYEICQAEWVIDKEMIEQEFLSKNTWAYSFLPHIFSSKVKSTLSLFQTRIYWNDPMSTALNQTAYWLQYWYMKRHMTRERVSLSSAFFHPRDTKTKIYSKLKSAVKKSSIQM